MKWARLLLCGTLPLTMLGYYYGTVFMANVPNPAPGLEISESTDVSRSDKCWVYMHLQKSGGTTVKGILRGVWKDRFAIYDSPHWVKGDKFLQYFGRRLATGNRWNVIAGGYPEALRRSRAAAEKCLWFTQFRHPIPCMVSAYYYCKRSSTDHACASKVVNAKDATLETFAKHWGNFAVRQFALSFVDITDVMEYSKTDAARERLPPSISDVPSLPGWYLLKMYLDSHVAPEASQHGRFRTWRCTRCCSRRKTCSATITLLSASWRSLTRRSLFIMSRCPYPALTGTRISRVRERKRLQWITRKKRRHLWQRRGPTRKSRNTCS